MANCAAAMSVMSYVLADAPDKVLGAIR